MFWLLAACADPTPLAVAGPPPSLPPTPKPTPVPRTPRPAPVIEAVAWVLEPHEVPHTSLTVLGPQGATWTDNTWDIGGVTQAHMAIPGSREGFALVARSGEMNTLDSWIEDHPPDQLQKGEIEVCGRKAPTLRLDKPEQDIACVIAIEGPNHPSYTPPMTEWVVGFEHGGLPTTVAVEVETAAFGVYEEQIAALFRGIVCR